MYSVAVVHLPLSRGFADTPYTGVAVELAEQRGLFLISNLSRADEAEARIGLEVEVDFEEVGPDLVLPQFRLSGAER